MTAVLAFLIYDMLSSSSSPLTFGFTIFLSLWHSQCCKAHLLSAKFISLLYWMLQWRIERGGANRSGRQSGEAAKMGVIAAKMGATRGHQASHDFLGRQNCSPPRAPITHTTPLESYDKFHVSLCNSLIPFFRPCNLSLIIVSFADFQRIL